MVDHWLCLSGGNALGAFHAGAWTSIDEAGLNVTRIAGASIGAVIGALIAGSAPGDRRDCLERFLSSIGRAVLPTEPMSRSATMQTMLFGHPGLFLPSMPGLAEIFPGMPRDISAFQRGAMRALLSRLIDFDRLNDSEIELSVTALDAETGEVVMFRAGETRLTVDHLMACTALPVLFKPVALEGRLFMDAGLAENLPLRALMDRDGPTRILALDLYGLEGRVGTTLNTVAHRAQDLAFACQSRHVLARYRRDDLPLTHLVLRDPDDDFAGKSFDFSERSIRRRVRLGREKVAEALAAQGHDVSQPTSPEAAARRAAR